MSLKINMMVHKPHSFLFQSMICISSFQSCSKVAYKQWACKHPMLLPKSTHRTEHVELVVTDLLTYKASAWPALTCREAPPRSLPLPGWSPGGRRCDSRSCNTPARSHPVARLYAASPLCIWLSPDGSQCDWNLRDRSEVFEKTIWKVLISVKFGQVVLPLKSTKCIIRHTDPQYRTQTDKKTQHYTV